MCGWWTVRAHDDMHLHLRLHLRRRLRLTAFCGPLAGMVKVSRITNNWPNTSESNSANTTIVHHDALVVLHIQSRCISRELCSRVLTADIPTQRQDNGRGPLGHRAHASSPPALGRAPLACPGNRQPTAASRQRTPGTRGGPHVRRVVASAAFPLRRGPLPLRGRRRRPLLVFLKGNAGRQRLRFPLDIRPDIARGKCWSPPLPFRFL